MHKLCAQEGELVIAMHACARWEYSTLAVWQVRLSFKTKCFRVRDFCNTTFKIFINC